MLKFNSQLILKSLIRQFDSVPCVACASVPADYDGLCDTCRKELPIILGERCNACGAELDGIFEVCSKCMQEDKRIWDSAFALYRMEGIARKLIHKFKYNKETALARTFALSIIKRLDQNFFDDIDLIIPVPLHWTRELLRGFNQSALICDFLHINCNIPTKNLLKRIKITQKQANLSRTQRKKNLIGVFSLKKGENCKNRTILLVDDVMTTGTTLSMASKVLLEAGALNVKVLVIARA